MSSKNFRSSNGTYDDEHQDNMASGSNLIPLGPSSEKPDIILMPPPKPAQRETSQREPSELEPSHRETSHREPTQRTPSRHELPYRGTPTSQPLDHKIPASMPSFRRYSQAGNHFPRRASGYDRERESAPYRGAGQKSREMRDMSFLADRNDDAVIPQKTYASDNQARDDAEMDDTEMDDAEMEDAEEDASDNGLFVKEAEVPRGRSSRAASLASPRRPHKRDFAIPMGAGRRLPSRASGFHIPSAGVNKAPIPVPTASISNASLLKRGLIRGADATMIKRATGPNDPENVQIINLVENQGLKWVDIAEILNDQRIALGANPSFTPNAVHNRYNRNAPLHFKAEGKEFIPINKRRGGDNGSRKWTAEGDELLVITAQQVDAKKWQEVADIFNSQSEYEITAEEAAKRMEIL